MAHRAPIRSVLLVVPPLVERGDTVGDRPDFEAYRLTSPVEPAQVAATLRASGRDCRIFDLGLYKDGGYAALRDTIRAMQPDAVTVVQSILTFATAQDFDGARVFEAARAEAPDALCILSGCYATNYPGLAVERGLCDYSIKGEIDFALPQLLDAVEAGDPVEPVPGVAFRRADGAVFKSEHYPVVDVATLPLPAYDLIPPDVLDGYYDFPEYGKIRFPEKSRRYRDIMTSRGCILRCSFCSVGHLRGLKQRYRRKTNAQVMAEIAQALDQGVEEIHFFDDLFCQSEGEILDFCNEITKRNLRFPWFVAQGQPLWPLTYDALAAMKETGMYRLIGPFESGSNRVLRQVVGKLTNVEHNEEILGWLKALDIETIAMFVVGMPGETAEEILQTVTFAERHPEIDYSVFSIATPMVGTRLMDQVTKKGLLVDQGSINRVIKRTVALYKTEAFSQVAMGVIRSYDWDRINFSTEDRRRKYARMVGLTMEQLDIVRQYSLKTFRSFFPDYDGPTRYADLMAQRDAGTDFDAYDPLIPAAE